MRMQRRFHIELDVNQARQTWLTDVEILRSLDQLFGHSPQSRKSAPENCTPRGSERLGIGWYAAGGSLVCGFLPVSDGTDVVVQWRHGLREWLDQMALRRRHRRFDSFCRLLNQRLEASSGEV